MTRLKQIVMGMALLGIYGSSVALAQSQPTPSQQTQSRQAQNRQAQNQRNGPKEIQAKAFDSPDQAVAALIDAAARNDKNALTAILGSAAEDILSSGDATQDEEERREFSRLASAKNHIERSSMDNAAAVVLVGDQDWPFPIPLVRKGQQWHFDAELGAVELLARQIGANELDAIEICIGYVGAQQEYAAQQGSGKGVRAYAQKIMSSPGANDGLYQAGAVREQLVPEGFAKAATSSQDANRKPYHGYFFRVLKEQGENAPGGAHKYVAGGVMIGGFALVAWPAEYGVTGIHTFIVSHDAKVFEKDLGPRTANLVAPIVSYDPDKSWTPID